MLWSATVTKDSPVQLELPFDLRITKACLGGKVAPKKRYMLQATYEDPFAGGEPAMATLCSLSENCENVDLDLVLDADEPVVLATGGSATIYLSGYMIMPDFDPEDFDSDDSDDSDDDSDNDDSVEDIGCVLDALSRASDSDDSDFEDEEDEPKVRELNSSDEESTAEEDDSEDSDSESDGDVDMEDESSGDSVNEDKISDSILKKIQEKAARIQQEQKKASSPAVGKKRRASSEPSESAPAKQKKQRVETPTKKAAASPAGKAVSPAGKAATHRNQDEKKNKSPLRRTLPGGLVIETVKQGSGKAAQKGKQVTVKYTGKLTNGKKFDSGTFSFRVGTRQVIQGWDMGVPGMKVGEQRKLIIPPKLAYGKKGAGKDIPPNSTLHFDVELLRC